MGLISADYRLGVPSPEWVAQAALERLHGHLFVSSLIKMLGSSNERRALCALFPFGGKGRGGKDLKMQSNCRRLEVGGGGTAV